MANSCGSGFAGAGAAGRGGAAAGGGAGRAGGGAMAAGGAAGRAGGAGAAAGAPAATGCRAGAAPTANTFWHVGQRNCLPAEPSGSCTAVLQCGQRITSGMSYPVGVATTRVRAVPFLPRRGPRVTPSRPVLGGEGLGGGGERRGQG